MVSQRERVETLVPPNLATIQGEEGIRSAWGLGGCGSVGVWECGSFGGCGGGGGCGRVGAWGCGGFGRVGARDWECGSVGASRLGSCVSRCPALPLAPKMNFGVRVANVEVWVSNPEWERSRYDRPRSGAGREVGRGAVFRGAVFSDEQPTTPCDSRTPVCSRPSLNRALRQTWALRPVVPSRTAS